MGCFIDKNKSGIQKQPTIQDISKNIDFDPILLKIRQKYKRYRIQTEESSQDKSMNLLQYQIRNIFISIIKQKLMLVNQHKITIKECKLEISQQILQIELIISKYVQLNYPDQMKNFLTLNDKFLIRVTQFLKTVYPRGQNIQAGELAKTFKQFDHTEDYQYDILKNAGFCFTSIDLFEITNSIKLFINKIITELDEKFKDFSSLIENIDGNFKIGRKISQNTSKYFTLNTGTIEINSMEVARVLIKWMEDLSQMINQCQDKLNPRNEYKFYKKVMNEDYVQFSKCQSSTFSKILNSGFITDLKIERKHFKQKQNMRQSLLKRFRISLLKMLIESTYNQSQVSKNSMEMIKYSANNNKFIEWMVEEQLIEAIQCLVQISSEYEQFRGILDLIKFKINDLMRCQILGTRSQLIQIFEKFKSLEKQGVLQIVKIKNRFNTPMSDAMLFFKMKSSFVICECQLVLAQQNKSEDLKATKNVETINHFLYELQRSPFGVLGQISVFLSSKSETVSQYSNKIKLSKVSFADIEKCFQNHQEKQKKQQPKQQKYPFICSKCFIFFPKFSNKFQVYKCNKPTCMITVCNACMKKKFQIKNNTVINALNQKIQQSKNKFKTTDLFKSSPREYLNSFQIANAQYLLKNVFLGQKMQQLNYIKQKVKNNKVRAQFIIKYILQTPNFERLYRQNDLKLNFIVITWKGGQVRFKCYRYDHLQNIIINCYQELQKYENYQMFEVNQFDIFYHVRPQGYCNFIQINAQSGSMFRWKTRQILQKGIYIFQGQSKHKMVKMFQNTQQINKDQYLLITYQIGSERQKGSAQSIQISTNINYDTYEPHLIIDVAKSLKRSHGKNKLKNYLQQLSTINQFQKHVQLTNMNVQNIQLTTIDTGIQSIQNIKSLSLSFNSLSNVQRFLSICKKLSKLSINNNKFQELQFKQYLPCLTELNANQNRIHKIKNIININKIEILNLKSNLLLGLSIKNKNILSSTKASRFQNLRQINISFNNISDLVQFQNGDQYFPYLTYINLKQNLIQVVPEIKLQKLQEIDFSSNKITNIDDFAKSQCPILTKLYLKNNNLKSIPKLNFINLLVVDISYNELSEIQQFAKGDYYINLLSFFISLKTPKNLPKLSEQLRIFGFESSNLSNGDVDELIRQNQFRNLKQLYLTTNQINQLPKITGLKSLKLICLEQNPINNIDLLIKNDKKDNQQKKAYQCLQRIWISLKCDEQQQFQQAKKLLQQSLIVKQSKMKNLQQNQDNQKYSKIAQPEQQKQKLQQNPTASRLVCWRYQKMTQDPQKQSYRQTFKFNKNHRFDKTMPKRQYLLNTLQSQIIVNERFKKRSGVNLYELHHQWLTVDMDEFVRYDWKDLVFLDLRGAAINNNQWRVFAQNASDFPNLKQIHLWDNKIEIIPYGCLQKFRSLQFIDFYKVGWQCGLNEESRKYLKLYKRNNPSKYVNF